MSNPAIIYTKTDEAPALATYSLLPIVQAFTKAAGVNVEIKDISLAARILAHFPEYLTAEQQQSDALAELGVLVTKAEANIIKLPNISASVPQLLKAIAELQALGCAIPNYPVEVSTDSEKEIKACYAKILGSAVNPVLREGNSDRRVAAPVKAYAKKHPHIMGEWLATSKTHVSSMSVGDFYSSEQSAVINKAGKVKIELLTTAGSTQVLKQETLVLENEIIDASVMSCKALCAFYEQEMQDAKDKDVMLSLHLKATMMKVSDPIIFGHAVDVYFKEVFNKHAAIFEEIGVDTRNGLGDVYAKIAQLPDEQRLAIEADIQAAYEARPELAMVNSDKGITNLHVPSDVIIDASMPAAIRHSGQIWDTTGQLADTKALIPDRCYAGVFQATIEFCKQNGAFDVTTMGNVSNVGLMAQKAEEYGSHDKTFEIPEPGSVRVIDEAGDVLLEHTVEKGDIWRMCQTKDLPIQDWVKLAVHRAKTTGLPAIFWLDEQRAHDRNLITKVEYYLQDHDTSGLDIKIMSPIKAVKETLSRVKAGQDTISVTGNVLRDYLTDLFPILELGTSAKMLSIVPLLAGGGLFETGAGGSAPRLVAQLLHENHLSWDSLGEFLALAVSLEDLAEKTEQAPIRVLADALNKANSQYLNNNRSPSHFAGEMDTRGSHFYLALYWAEAMAEQKQDLALQAIFTPVAQQLSDNEAKILTELKSVQGGEVDLGGYYQPEQERVNQLMRPSACFNVIVASL
ncbi:MAG: NADP-dependent isocitrate dehydrogenase [Methyloprofundus sp.]|nr:NADP-dependent isocitrate dehydrogenase [Methyloprofundus sp.]